MMQLISNLHDMTHAYSFKSYAVKSDFAKLDDNKSGVPSSLIQYDMMFMLKIIGINKMMINLRIFTQFLWAMTKEGTKESEEKETRVSKHINHS